MIDEATDVALNRILEELDDPSLLDQPVSGDETCEIQRAFRETIGLLAGASEPLPVSDRLRQSLSRALAGLPSGAAVHRPEPRRWGRMGFAGPWTWTRSLAAGLTVATIGLAAISLWLAGELRRDRWELAELRRERPRIEATVNDLATTREELAAVRRQVSLVSFGAEVCPLRPPIDGAILPGARGVLIIAANRAGWFLTAEGLAAERPGQVFQLWFRRAGSAQLVPAMASTALPDQSLELSSEAMPQDTNAVFLTLEDGEGASEPRGPIVLYGDDAMRIL